MNSLCDGDEAEFFDDISAECEWVEFSDAQQVISEDVVNGESAGASHER